MPQMGTEQGRQTVGCVLGIATNRSKEIHMSNFFKETIRPVGLTFRFLNSGGCCSRCRRRHLAGEVLRGRR